MKKTYTIKDLELISGIKAHTIRIWEKRYNLIEPHRTSTNIRYYTDEDIKKLLNVSLAVKNGMKISHVAKLNEDELMTSVLGMEKYQDNFESKRKRLKVAMMEYDGATMNDIINKCFIKYGAVETLDEILGPFINEVGLLWQVSAISVGHEHFASNILRTKMFALLDDITQVPKPGAPSVVLFLPSGELHELSLLYLWYHLKRTGFNTLYLGQDVPLEYVFEASQKFRTNYFISVLTTHPHFEELPFYFDRIKKLFKNGGQKFLLSGWQVSGDDVDFQNNDIQLFKSVGALKESALKLK